MKAYGFTSKNEALEWKKNPIDHTAVFAANMIPIIFVVGDADVSVPIAENATPFEDLMLRDGGEVTIVHKPNVGHHPHSLQAPAPILNFILRVKGLYRDDTT